MEIDVVKDEIPICLHVKELDWRNYIRETDIPQLIFSKQNKQFEFDINIATNFLNTWEATVESTPAVLALRRLIAHRKDSIYAKDISQLDEMWARGDRRKVLLKSKRFLAMLSDAQARGIIQGQDMELIRALRTAMRRSPTGVLPSSPRLSTQMRIQLMKTVLTILEPEKAEESELENALRQGIRSDSVLTLCTADFPRECNVNDYQYCSFPPNCVGSPSMALAHSPLESSLCLLMRNYVWKKQAVFASYELQLRHGLWETVILKIGHDETPLSLIDITIICDYGDLEDAEPEFVRALFEIGHPLVQDKLIYTGLLTTTQMDQAWQNGEMAVCRTLLQDPDFLSGLTESQAMDIMAVNDTQMLQTLAVHIKLISGTGEEASTSRLSPETRNQLLNFILTHPDKDVQRLAAFYSRGFFPSKQRV